MPSSYTSNLGIELPADGELDGLWGDAVNDNMNIIDRAINGVVTLSLSGTTSTLTTSDGVLSNGQYKMLVLGGSPSGTHTITIAPSDAQKVYFVQNTTAQSVVFTQGSGGNVTIATGDSGIIYSNGGGASAAVVNLTDHFAMSSAKITGGTITGITDLAIADGGTGASTAADARTNLGLGTMSTQAASSVAITGGSITGITDLAVSDGGTGASTAADARTNLGLTIGTNVQAYDAGLQSISGLTTSANQMIYTTASDTYATASLTAAGRAILDDADASAQRTTLGLAIGTNVQAYDAGLQSISGLTTAADRMIYTTASDVYAVTTLTAAGRALLDDADAAAQRTTLGAQATITGAATSITSSDLTASRALTSDGSGKVAASSVTATELGYLSGISGITQRTTSTGSAKVPSGTEAQRDGSPAAGYFRFNSDITKFEGYNGSAWGSVGGGATGGGSDEIFFENGQVVTTNYTITDGKNAGSFGPITINSGVTVTVGTGEVWTIV
jgi:hypothetical protein